MEVIYFNPIFVSPSNHKYDCQDYEHIDPHYGEMCIRDSPKSGEPMVIAASKSPKFKAGKALKDLVNA